MTGLKSSHETIEEQIPSDTPEFSSQYGPNHGHNYNVGNICRKGQIYPSYGDSTDALVFRTYGPWWMNVPSYKEMKRNFKRLEKEFTSRDFLEIEYPNLMSQCTSVNVYETFNPGSLEVVYLGKENPENGNITWHQVWKFPEPFSIVLVDNQEIVIENGRQQIDDIFPNHINNVTSALHSLRLNADKSTSAFHTQHTYPPAARIPRILKIPVENKISFSTRHVRMEFDHSTSDYYIEIDSITLSGQTTDVDLTFPTKLVNREEQEKEENESISKINLTELPFDILFHMCSYLDLRSLIRFSSTCQQLHEQCLHSLQFQSLDLQPYWNYLTNDAIENFLLHHCSQTRYLSLAWTKSIQQSSFDRLLNTCADHLLQLNLACCQYLTGEYIETIVQYCPNLEVLNLDGCVHLNNLDFIPLTNLQHLRSLSVYRTRIDARTLLPLIDNNKEHLEDINLGSCRNLLDAVGIIKLIFACCSKLRSLDLWRASNLTPGDYLAIAGSEYDMGDKEMRFSKLSDEEQEDLVYIYSIINIPEIVPSLAHMTCLREIDIGWTRPPGGFVRHLVQQAGHLLIKIFLTACRDISNEDIIAISENCLQLRQLDILGSNVIVETSLECVLKRCVEIELLDISFCSKIPEPTIQTWKTQYKCCFKRIYLPKRVEDIYTEFN